MNSVELVSLLASRGITLAAAESLTGGALLSNLISVPGASNVVAGGIVCYSTASKIKVLGVDAEIINTHGAVSEATAVAMAKAVRERFSAQVGIATTGVAGPDLQEEKQVGTVYLAIADNSSNWVEQFQFQGERNQIREQSVMAAIALLGKYSDNLPSAEDVSSEK